MAIVEVFNESELDCVIKVAADSYESLKKNVEDKLNTKIKTFVNKKDGEEIDDNDELMDKLDCAAKKFKKLQLIAIEASDDESGTLKKTQPLNYLSSSSI